MYRETKFVFFSFICFTVISYLYTLFTGTYNGDFLGRVSQLSQWELFLNFLYTIIPFFILYLIHRHYKHREDKHKIKIPTKNFGQFLFVLIVFKIFVTYLFGVGIMGREIYQAPRFITPFIQISNRFVAIYGVIIYGVVVEKQKKMVVFLWTLVFILSFLRGSLGVFVYFAFYLIIRYYDYIVYFFKKKVFLILMIILLSPIVVTKLYNIRDQIRAVNTGDVTLSRTTSFSEVIFGRLAGRLSSFPNSAIIMEKKEIIRPMAQKYFSSFQFSKETLLAFYGVFDRDDLTYMSIILESFGYSTRLWSLMTGTQGSLLIGYYTSYLAFAANLLTILIVIILTFRISCLFNNNKIKDVIFMFFCFAVMSGVAFEYMIILLNILLYSLFFLITRFFVKLKKL